MATWWQRRTRGSGEQAPGAGSGGATTEAPSPNAERQTPNAARGDAETRFLVVVPTVRRSSVVVAQIQDSLTLPADLVVMDGRQGKAQTLNYALTRYLDPGAFAFYVTVDDDYIPAPGWQEAVIACAESIPRLGAVAIDLSQNEIGRRAMAEIHPAEQIGRVRFRENTGKMNLTGVFIAMPARVALEIGPTPILADTRYQFYEDGWRCRQLYLRGYRYGYVVLDTSPHLVQYPDPPEYQQMKWRDEAAAREILHTVWD